MNEEKMFDSFLKSFSNKFYVQVQKQYSLLSKNTYKAHEELVDTFEKVFNNRNERKPLIREVNNLEILIRKKELNDALTVGMVKVLISEISNQIDNNEIKDGIKYALKIVDSNDGLSNKWAEESIDVFNAIRMKAIG
jgi:hypothetical protein